MIKTVYLGVVFVALTGSIFGGCGRCNGEQAMEEVDEKSTKKG